MGDERGFKKCFLFYCHLVQEVQCIFKSDVWILFYSSHINVWSASDAFIFIPIKFGALYDYCLLIFVIDFMFWNIIRLLLINWEWFSLKKYIYILLQYGGQRLFCGFFNNFCHELNFDLTFLVILNVIKLQV